MVGSEVVPEAPLSSAASSFTVTPTFRNLVPAEEGDVRLVDQSTVANWQLGRLEIFFEGSWSQVCSSSFDGADADVACRQLGFGAGTVGPKAANGAQVAGQATVFPEVALTAVGCNGSEASLLECGRGRVGPGSRFDRGCLSDDSAGLVIACVAEGDTGTYTCQRDMCLVLSSRVWITHTVLCHVLQRVLLCTPAIQPSRFSTGAVRLSV